MTEPQDRFRWFVGYAISECAEVDYLAADLVEEILGLPTSGSDRLWGDQGAQMVAALKRASEADGKRRDRLDELARRYEEAFEARNVLVHGMYDGFHDGDHSLKLVRERKGSADHGATRFDLSEQSLSDLIVEAVALKGAILWMLNELRNPDWPMPG